MALRHIVLLSWKPGTTAEQIEAVRSGLSALPAAIPQLKSYVIGSDAGIDGTCDFGIVADFASVEDYETYRDHPDHRAVITGSIVPILESRVATQQLL